MESTVDIGAIDDLILGRGVKRGRHELPASLRDRFHERLEALGFRETNVASVDIEVGVRVPAWFVRGATADFGMVFWEVFTPKFKRKLFASQIRNGKGDWDVMLPAASKETIRAAPHLAESYDPSRPVGMF